MTNEQIAYLAGAIDGEGTLHIGAKRRRETAANPTYYGRMAVSNTNLTWLETLQSWSGGAIYKVGNPHSRSTRRQCYRLEWRGVEARIVLPLVRPYLLIKAEQADYLLEYFALAAKRRSENLALVPREPALLERLNAIHMAVRELNLRGLNSAPPRYRVPLANLCGISCCNRKRYSRGYCKQHYKKYIERGGPAWHEQTCAHCRKVFVSKRSDARYCSSRCSGRAYYVARCEASRKPSSAVPEATVPLQAVEDA